MVKLRVPRPIEVLLVLSLALNLFVIGGFAFSQYVVSHPTVPVPGAPDRRIENFAATLGIDTETSKPFKDWRRRLRTAQGVLTQQNQPLAAAVWEELATASPDRAHIQQLLDEMAVHRRAFQDDTTGATLAFLQTLDEAKKQRFIAMLADRSNPLAGPVRNALGN